MDVCESNHQRQKPRRPLIPEERNNAVTSRRPQTRDVSSRFRSHSPSPSPSPSTTSRYRSPSPSPSPSPSTTSAPRRSQSPTPTRTVRINSESTPKRAQSAERKRPSRPSSPPSPLSTPVKDSSIDMQTSSRKVLSGRLPEGLWPSTMRRLSVSFQSDSDSDPPSKKEKSVTSALSERPLRPSSNVHKQDETPTNARKPIPEKKKSPPTGKNAFDQSENSKPVDRVPSRSMDQHRWPSKTGGKASSNSLARSLDLIDKMARTSIPPISGNKSLSARRLSLDGVVKPLEKTATDSARLLSIDDRVKIGLHSIDDNHLRVSRPKKLVPEKPLDKVTSTTSAVRSQSLHIRPSSPSNTSVSASQRTITRGVSLTPTSSSNPTRGVSPTPAKQSVHTRGRSPTPAKQSTPSGGPSPTPAKQSTPSRGLSPTPAKQSTPSRGLSPTPAKQSTSIRGISPTPARQSTSIRGISPTPARHTTSTRGISPTPAIPSRGTSPTPSRGASPTPTRPSTSPRGISPSRIRPSNTSSQTSSSASVLSFIADFRNGKKSASYIEDAHQLRLVYNRYLQWRFANARADAVLHIKKAIAEKTLYNVWNDTLALCDTVILKRIGLQQLRLELKLNLLLNEQMAFLDDWVLLERDHASSLSGAVKDFEASTVRLPVTGGARVDIESLKLAVSSAVDVMQAMGSSICSLLPRVEMMNSFVSELAFVALQESDMLDQCDALLASTAAMQVEEYSLRTHLIQITQSSTSNNSNSE